MRSKRSKRSKKFNLGTIFQMKNHSIAFEASNLAQIQKKPMAFVRNE
jgi:hypothetical protein